MTHLSNKREKHTYILLARGEVWAEVECSANRIREIAKKYRRALNCEIVVKEC